MDTPHLSNDQRYFLSYDQFQVHELMLRDHPRVTAYHDAIMNNKDLFRDKVVLDVGSGTGILSMFAAKAGARLVYAVDACPTICALAKELITCNGLQDRIRVINKRIEEIDKFDEPADIIISEWMGFYLFHESMLESVIYARDHFLSVTFQTDEERSEKADSILLFPSHAYLYCAPFLDQNIRTESNGMWKNYFGLNMSPVLSRIKNADLDECVIETVEPSQLVHDAQLIQSIDLRTVRIDDLRSMHSFCEFNIDNTCIVSGFSFWFDCYFSSSQSSSVKSPVCLTTSPHAAATHWKQTLVFLPEDIYPLKGDCVPVNITLKQSSANRRQYNLTIAIEDMDGGSQAKVDDQQTETSASRKRQRHGSSTKSSDPPVLLENPSGDASSGSDDDNEEDAEDEHPMPCPCDRPRCKLIRAIMEKFSEEDNEELSS